MFEDRDNKKENIKYDDATLYAGVAGLGLCASWLYPGIFTLGNIAIVSTALSIGGTVMLVGGLTYVLLDVISENKGDK